MNIFVLFCIACVLLVVGVVGIGLSIRNVRHPQSQELKSKWSQRMYLCIALIAVCAYIVIEYLHVAH